MKLRISTAKRRTARIILTAATVATVAGTTASAASAAEGNIFVYGGNLAVNEGYTQFAAAAGRGLEVGTALPSNLAPYRCVVLPANRAAFSATQLTAFADYVGGGGTLVALAEHSSFPGAISNMNAVANRLASGLDVQSASIDGGFNVTTNIEATPWTHDVHSLAYAATSAVPVVANSAAQVVARTRTTSLSTSRTPFIGAEEIGEGLFVVGGDTNTFSNNSGPAFFTEDNGQLVSNVCGDDPNQPPSAPGTPEQTSGENPSGTGEIGLSWAASTDPDGDPVTYTLQHRDADDSDWSTVASGLTSNSYSFDSTSPEGEGTWRYRVKATDDESSDSGFSGESDAIVVDKGAPNAPSAAADRSPDYDPAGTGDDWFRDSVTVSFSDNGDPDLTDGSAGSGVDPASVPAPVTKDTSGSHTVSGTVSDNAGNESAPGSLDVKVDATDPTVEITCPSGDLILGSPAPDAAWTASDGESGLASAAGGSVGLDTSSVGTKTATAPQATDNVGNTGGDSCTYRVVYDFAGFFRPVNNLPTLNVVNAGRAIPVKFSLAGDQGLGIFAADYPKSQQIPCDSSAEVDGVEETLTAGSSELSYDPVADQYSYVWKTSSAWAGTCRQFVAKLDDGTSHRANFQFK